ncbi:MAG TPA: hypothetical protein VK249_17440 [Anaerolineales bacterium]|nr:hypothetical protein [Anaerolineales bacterium]
MEPNRSRHESFAQLLHAEWNKFRTVRGWVIGLVIAALVTVLPGLLIAARSLMSCEGPSGDVCPSTPVGPGGQAVEDRFYFVHQPLAGDGSITVRVTSMTGIITYPPPNHDQIVSGLVPWAKAGVILKENIEQGSAYAAVMVTGSHGVRMQYNYTEDIAGQPGGVSADSPRWLRLTRSGDTLTGYESTDGTQWTEVGTAQLAELPATVQIGLFVASPCDLTVSEGACRFTQGSANFDQISLQGDVSGAWSRDDVGDTPEMTDWERYHRANGLVESGDIFTVTGTGDIAPLVGGWTIERILTGTVAGLIVVIIVAVSFATADYRQGLSRTILPVHHQGDQALLAKATVIGMVTFVVGSVATIVAVLLGQQILISNGNIIPPVSLLTELRVMLGTAALLAVVAVFALALGALFRRGIAVIIGIAVIVLPYILAVVNALPLDALQWLLRLTPAAGFAIQQSVPGYPQVIGTDVPLLGYYPLAPWTGFAVLCGYTALAFGLAVFRLRRNK